MTAADDKRLQDQMNAANNAGAHRSRFARELCHLCGPGYRVGDPGCKHSPTDDTCSEVETLAVNLREMLTVRFDWDDYRISEFIDRVTGIVADAGYVSPARHDADIAAAKAAGAAEVVALVEAVLDYSVERVDAVAKAMYDLDGDETEKLVAEWPRNRSHARWTALAGAALGARNEQIRAALTTGGEG